MVAILRRFEDDGAVAVELRPTLDTGEAKLSRKLTNLVKGYFDYLWDCACRGQNRPVVMGLVPSLYKQETMSKEGPPSWAPDVAVWQEQSRVWVDQTECLLSLIRRYPSIRTFVVGFDACGRERGSSFAALMDAYSRIRGYNQGLWRTRPGRTLSLSDLMDLIDPNTDRELSSEFAFDQLDCSWVESARLGITVHAGEDFSDPMTGLRHIWEALRHLDLNEGDRVGHAVAAALSPVELKILLDRRAHVCSTGEIRSLGCEKWRLLKPRGVHLADLAWEASLTNSSFRHLVLSLLGERASRTFGVPTDSPRMVTQLMRPDAALALVVPSYRFVEFSETEVPAEDCEWVVLDTQWKRRFEVMRMKVISELRRRRVVVESCPTSNASVAHTLKPPLIQLWKEGVRCGIATDDPGNFNAWPRDEQTRVQRYETEQGDRIVAEAVLNNSNASFIRV